MNHDSLWPRSYSASSDGIVQMFPSASAVSIPSFIFPTHHNHKKSTDRIKHSQSQQWESSIGNETNGATARGEGGGGETFVVRRKSPEYHEHFQRRVRQPPSHGWLEKVFQRRDCIKFIPASNHSDRCHCGRVSAFHSQLALSRFTTSIVIRHSTAGDRSLAGGQSEERARWTIGGCTAPSATDAYGVIQFQGGPHVHKARYVRLSFDSDPADVLRLLVREWGLNMPRLVITVHGGMADFEVPERLGKVFREGLLKAAETTGAWILTAGVDSGVVKHIARALDEAGISARMRSRIVTVGIAPWGLLQHRERLLGRNVQVPYDKHSSDNPSPSARRDSPVGLVLNDRHSYFLLADNGTVGRYGADIVLRRRLEEFLASRAEKNVRNGRCARAENVDKSSRIPIVSVVLEGGLCTLNLVHRYLSGSPSIPVVICEGSGRVADLLAYIARNLTHQRTLPAHLRPQLLCQVRRLSCNSAPTEQLSSSDAILDRLVQCAQNRDELLTIFPLHKYVNNAPVPSQMDHAILRALLQAQNVSPIDQLLMTLVWGREDIARTEIFRQDKSDASGAHTQQINADSLAKPMMEALLMSRVEFVKLFLEQGLSLKRFLTFDRLERLYNAESAKDALWKNERRGTVRQRRCDRKTRRTAISLPEIGVAIERLMGNAYRSAYTTREFKMRYERAKCGGSHPSRKSITRNFSSIDICLKAFSDRMERSEQQRSLPTPRKCALALPMDERRAMVGERGKRRDGVRKSQTNDDECAQYGRKRSLDFEFPFNELMLWAVLTRRHEMARLFWQYGEEPMAKALVAIRLYKCMSREAAHDYTEVEVSNQLRECANSFRDWSLELLHNCHQQDSQLTMRLLTAELPNWGHRTCLSLAVVANNKRFLAHPCCQILLAELWHGGLRFRSQSNVKVVLGILFPPSILLLDFKTNSLDNCSSNVEEEEEKSYDENEDEFEQTPEGGEPQKRRRTKAADGKGAKRAFGKMSQGEATEDGEEAQLRSRRQSWTEEEQPKFERCQCLGRRKDSQMATQISMVASLPPFVRLLSKFVLFYCAPITSFWVWSISYATFMLALIFVLLVEFPNEVSPTEWFLFIYVLSFAMEHFRKLFVLESSSLIEKLGVFYNRYWNILTTVAILSYFLGFLFRFNPSTVHSLSRTVLASNSVLWHMKLFDFLSVHPRIGPYITMAGKMVLAMSYIIVLLMVTLMAFGVARQSITFPHEKWDWILVRNIFYKPYFMLYGEVYAGEIDTCGDEGANCVPGGWIPPVLMTIFLLVANILLINMLIAIFNNIFNVTNAMSQQVWMFQRYEQVLEYKSTPILPPPLTPFAHLLMLVRRLFSRQKQTPPCPFHLSDRRAGIFAQGGSFALKMQLATDELRELEDFEEDCMDDLSRRKIRNFVEEIDGKRKDNGERRGRREEEQEKGDWQHNANRSCCCCCGGRRQKSDSEAREREWWESGERTERQTAEDDDNGMAATPAEEAAMSRALKPLADSHSSNGETNHFSDQRTKLSSVYLVNRESATKPVDGNAKRQLRVAPMSKATQPRNSSSVLNDDIDQMLLAVLSRQWENQTKGGENESDEGRR